MVLDGHSAVNPRIVPAHPSADGMRSTRKQRSHRSPLRLWKPGGSDSTPATRPGCHGGCAHRSAGRGHGLLHVPQELLPRCGYPHVRLPRLLTRARFLFARAALRVVLARVLNHAPQIHEAFVCALVPCTATTLPLTPTPTSADKETPREPPTFPSPSRAQTDNRRAGYGRTQRRGFPPHSSHNASKSASPPRAKANEGAKAPARCCTRLPRRRQLVP